jgi:hypothetical protein
VIDMAILPLTARFKSYRGSKENLRRKSVAAAVVAQRISTYVNGLIANNPREIQQYMFASIARDLGLTTEEVRSAISDGGYNGITFGVREDDRRELARFKTGCAQKNAGPAG